MAITAEVVETIAEVGVDDEYRVELIQRRRRVTYSPDEAIQLADELVAAAARVREAMRVDTVARLQVGAFDLLPSCRDCTEGKHRACIGSTHVERGEEIDEVACECDRAGHRTCGGVA